MKWLKSLFSKKEETKEVRKFHVTMLAVGFMSNTYKIFDYEAEGMNIGAAAIECLTPDHWDIIVKHYKGKGNEMDKYRLWYEYEEVLDPYITEGQPDE